jgi:hypothetical protein
MNLKEICLKEKPTHEELCFIIDASVLSNSTEELNYIVNFCYNHLSWNYYTPVVLNSLKRNKFCNEELLLKIKALHSQITFLTEED